MAEWVKVEDRPYECCKMRIGRIVVIAAGECPALGPGYSIEHHDDPKALEQESIDAAKAAAEQALREMHDALAMHFAPVLRWQESAGGWTATLGCWILTARQNRWTIRQEIAPNWCRDVVASPSVDSGYRADEAQARRDAELVLRSFDVVFRTEGER